MISLHILWKLFIVPLNCHHGVFVISHLLIPIMQYGDHILCYHKNNCIQQQICKYVATCSTWMVQFIDTFSWKRILKFFMFAIAYLVLVISIFTFHLCTQYCVQHFCSYNEFSIYSTSIRVATMPNSWATLCNYQTSNWIIIKPCTKSDIIYCPCHGLRQSKNGSTINCYGTW